MEWYQQSPEEVAQSLDTSLTTGLSSGSAQSKLETFGPNELKEQEGKSFLQKLIAQFSDFLILILIAAALISVFVGEAKDAIVIMSIVIINALLGLYQEGKAEKALEALKKMASPTAKVLRDGNPQEISSSQLVPGDLVILETGDIIPADIRLVESSNLKVEEASLTGESVPVEKRAQETYSEEVSLGDRHNMAYMSTIITYGRGRGIVVETAEGTEIGKIAAMIQTFEEEPTPLQRKLNQLGKVLGMTTIAVCVAVFGIGLLQGREILEMFMVSISLAVAAIPEGLPAIVTIVLAIGMNKMVERNAIVKKLLAVETLGATSVICTDKTGTLTQNEMTVVKVLADNKLIEVEGTGYEPVGDFKLEGSTITTKESSGLKLLLTIAALANDAKLDNSSGMYKIIGDPTEGALITLAGKAGIDSAELNHMYKRIEEIPFDSERKMMTTFHDMPNDEGVSSFTKGAPDIIIDRCNRIILDGKVSEFTPELKSEVLRVNSELSRAALRVLAFAFKEYPSLPTDPSPDENESDMIFVGLTGMIDPPRPEARDAIALCKKAGVNAIMITGDYKETAFAIAKDLGMADTEDQAIMGEKIDGMSDEELKEVVKNTKVFARVSPEHKVRIVSALRANGDIAAMTGDGVNDALAIKKADIGVSMGITGTDVAKNTADMILTDDNFASIVAAVEEGRIIFSNIKKFVYFLLSCNIGEILLVFTSILMNLPVPLLPIQLLWLNLVTDSFPALALGVEKGEPDIMNQPPRNPDEAILDRRMLVGVTFQAIAVAAASLSAYLLALRMYGLENIEEARTITFATLIVAELLRAYSSRSQKFTLVKIGIFSNKSMVYATLGAFLLLLAVIYIPFMNGIFYTFPLSFVDWEIVLSFAFIPLVVGELTKVVMAKISK
ncbi:cation-translocating P-type ATPase [Gudongella oleilytica]|uniref:cation-translocating P-type ATPase n=1 Tax=Gudongella oleilytica TaxID=1582259 RepID=UPI002A36E99A|nr:cation-translocating P-type ATPase [Gudongella oleilytica]MDY0257574.1 cation-translocating P-type ATPase [Gudongella oleilytica]HMM69200.1 cation-translocating P-type ATPase [Gudongella oleilytica]